MNPTKGLRLQDREGAGERILFTTAQGVKGGKSCQDSTSTSSLSTTKVEGGFFGLSLIPYGSSEARGPHSYPETKIVLTKCAQNVAHDLRPTTEN